MIEISRQALFAVIVGMVMCTAMSGYCREPGSKQTNDERHPVQSARLPDLNVVFNHAYLVLDEKTYQDVAASEFLKIEFAGFAQRTTITGDGSTWSGTYLYGERTYLEFFPPKALDNPEKCGIGFGVEEPGKIKLVQDRLAQLAGKPLDLTLKTRLRDEREIPWFYSTGLPSANGATLETWVMEYHPAYLPTWNSDFPKGADPLSRRAYLADRYKPDRYLREIVGLTIALKEVEGQRLRDQLAAMGYAVTPIEGGHLARGPELEIVIRPATVETNGIFALRMTTNRQKSGAKEFRFGPRSVLRFGDDKTATWTF